VSLHAEVPLVAFLGFVHLGVAFAWLQVQIRCWQGSFVSWLDYLRFGSCSGGFCRSSLS
jgi:hypothetical protein